MIQNFPAIQTTPGTDHLPKPRSLAGQTHQLSTPSGPDSGYDATGGQLRFGAGKKTLLGSVLLMLAGAAVGIAGWEALSTSQKTDPAQQAQQLQADPEQTHPELLNPHNAPLNPQAQQPHLQQVPIQQQPAWQIPQNQPVQNQPGGHAGAAAPALLNVQVTLPQLTGTIAVTTDHQVQLNGVTIGRFASLGAPGFDEPVAAYISNTPYGLPGEIQLGHADNQGRGYMIALYGPSAILEIQPNNTVQLFHPHTGTPGLTITDPNGNLSLAQKAAVAMVVLQHADILGY